MRLQTSDGRTVHLGYCFNVLPGETVEALVDQIHRYCGPVRRALEVLRVERSPDGIARLGIGLWIAAPAARVLADDPDARRALARALADEHLYVFTLNGFPYGGFHAPRVKERVFLPSWAEPARLTYTMDLAAILAELLPDDVEAGSISTVPLGPAEVDAAAALAGVRAAGEGLAALAARTGRRIELAIEPEPGAAVERAGALAAMLAGVPHVAACLDTCHAAVVDEDPGAALAALAETGVRCAKIQISSALVARHPDREEDRAALAAFDEPRFLHQVRTHGGGAMDLPEALAGLDTAAPWRIHFHVPVHRADMGAVFGTTRGNIAPALAAALAQPEVPHLEVETYTWSVLPEGERPTDDAGLIAGIARELAWTLDVLAAHGVTPA